MLVGTSSKTLSMGRQLRPSFFPKYGATQPPGHAPSARTTSLPGRRRSAYSQEDVVLESEEEEEEKDRLPEEQILRRGEEDILL